MFSNLVVLSSDSEDEPIQGPGAIRDLLPPCVPRPPLPAPVVSSKKGKKTLDDLTVYIDPGILNGGQGGQVLSALQAQDAQCVIQTQPVARSILWTRTPTHLQGEELCREKVDMIILFPAEEFLLMVHRHKENPQGGWSNEILNKAVTGGTKTPSLVIMEMENYFRSHKSRKRQPEAGVLRDSKSRKRERKQSPEALPLLTRKEVEEEMIDFQLLVGFRVRFVETWKEFADFVCMFNKAVTEAPDK